MWNADNIKTAMPDTEYEKGMDLVRSGLLREARRDYDEMSLQTAEEGRRFNQRVSRDRLVCDCAGEKPCRHMAAALIYARQTGYLEELDKRQARRDAQVFFNAAGSVLPEMEEISLEVTLVLQSGRLRVGIRVGREKMYVVKSLPLFLAAREENGTYEFNKGFSYDGNCMGFSAENARILDILTALCENGAIPDTGPEAKLLPLGTKSAAQVLEALSDMRFRLMTETNVYGMRGVRKEGLPVHFVLNGVREQLTLTASLPDPFLPLTKDMSYVYAGGEIWPVEQGRRQMLSVLSGIARDGRAMAVFSASESERVMNELLPFLMYAGNLSIDGELKNTMVRLPLKARVYLDRADKDVIAKVSMVYGDNSIDPFTPGGTRCHVLLWRDPEGEKAVLDLLATSGFRVRRGMAYLHGNDNIWDFIANGVHALNAKAEVYLSHDFERIKPRRPSLSGYISMKNGRLRLQMMESGTPVEELSGLMEAIRRHKQYFRFSDGQYLDIGDMASWQPFAEAVAAGLSDDREDMPAYRAAYLKSLIDSAALPVSMDEEAMRAAQFVCTVPDSPIACLRPYQKTGYEWLYSLYSLRMGGILADEMGLGKTVQTIAAILSASVNAAEYAPALIIAPTSLVYNWMGEIRRFAPGLECIMIEGMQQTRERTIDSIAQDRPDVVITSYPLIRRDIAMLEEMHFRFVILDEAQNIKNARSVGARSVKRLQADCRLALTGTPMENNAGELWSLFDFVLPGYLNEYPDFLSRYGEGEYTEELLERIRPFLLRRLKKDVLKDLPPCIDSVQMSFMPAEQRKVYDAVLLLARQRLSAVLEKKDKNRSHTEILSAIMQLRQCCCHPLLCDPDYRGTSGKTEMLLDILRTALPEGRRVLIFSQFTSMLHLIGDRLTEEGMDYLYLDGNTPPEERQQLSERFNGGEGNVFLVSLKAGGTGLNLTGADTVIHYDPWWNPAAEDQATGRAHRIGQTHTVQVIRLIMHASIEEDVLRMSDGKRRLFEKLITPGEKMPTGLTEEEIIRLLS